MLGIIGAMSVEVEGLKQAMTEKREKTIGGMAYVSGILYGKEVVVTICGEGKVNASMCAQAMIMEYKPELIINTGVGGGIAKELKICDVVVADAVTEHDCDATALGHPLGYIFGIDAVEIPCDRQVSALLEQCVTDCGLPCHRGIVASGDQFISSNEKKQWLSDTFNASVCEMEGGAIGHVCARNNVPFGVLRAISDGGDDDAKMSFPEFAEKAAKNSIEVMKLFVQRI